MIAELSFSELTAHDFTFLTNKPLLKIVKYQIFNLLAKNQVDDSESHSPHEFEFQRFLR